MVITSVVIGLHMAMIWIQVGKDIVKDVLLDEGSSVNIMVNEL
jgi:hypothetical protein